MRRLIIEPEGWSCRLTECRPGLFVFDNELCLKDDYRDGPYICDGGETFWGGTDLKENRDQLIVQPVKAVWIERPEHH